MSFDIFSALVAFAFVSSITPGPNNLMLMASGTNFGIRRTIPHMLGVGIGFMIMVLLVGVGLMQVFDRFPVIYLVLKIVSICYLVFLAWKIATAAPLNSANNHVRDDSHPFTFSQAALFQWVNPKAWAMALTAISAYTPPAQPLYSVLTVALIFGVVNLPSVGVWVMIGTQLRKLLEDPMKLRMFNIGAAVLLLGSLYPVLNLTAS